MRALLLALPTHSPFLRRRVFPNLGICSLAANTDAAHVRCLDLMLCKDVDDGLRSALDEVEPAVVGLSAMSFQYATAVDIANKIKQLRPHCRILLGGYHASSGYELIAASAEGRVFDFLVRGEGEASFDLLMQALACGDDRFDRIDGLSWWDGGTLVHNPRGENLDLATLRRPARHRRLRNDFVSRGVRVDTLETSRGCTHDCSICNILQMYGRTYREYALDRVIEDALSIRSTGVTKGFFVDDNITLHVPRFKRLLERIIDERVGLEWLCQVSAAGIASDAGLAPLMAEAGVVHVYVGFEHMAEDRLGFYKSSDQVEVNRIAARRLTDNGISMFGSFLIGAPDDTEESIRSLVRQVRTLDIDLPLIMCVTPFLGTKVREELLAEDLVVNPTDFTTYDIEHVNVRTRHLDAHELRRLQLRSMLGLYFDPRTRAGRHVLRSLLGGAMNLSEVGTVLRSILAELGPTQRIGRRLRALLAR